MVPIPPSKVGRVELRGGVPIGEGVSDATGSEDAGSTVPVFTGTHAEGLEFGLVLDARGIPYLRVESGGVWTLRVEASAASAASYELQRYGEERIPHAVPAPFVPFAGAGAAAAVYAAVVILVAYLAGLQSFGVDWFEVGALQSKAGSSLEWWRPLTALTLHLDQEHLLGNLLFGVGIGTLAGRVFGPGFAWFSVLAAGAAANAIDLWLSPWHRAVGASTALFGALGLLAGFGWGRPHTVAGRLYRWAPLFGGVSLLALLGAGNEHVDVLGHLLGFAAGTSLGWILARSDLPLLRRAVVQWSAGAVSLLALGAAWFAALSATSRGP